MNFRLKCADRAKSYREPSVRWGKEVAIVFYAFDPDLGGLRRKRIKLNRELKHIQGKRARREYAEDVCRRIREELQGGWNPWIAQSDNLIYTTFEAVVDGYRTHLYKLLDSNNMREESVASYLSYLRVMVAWMAKERPGVRYAYQFDKRLVNAFLDYVFLDRNNKVQTRNNYLAWVRTFAKYMLQRSFIEADPTAGIPQLKKKSKGKNRDVIPDDVLQRIRDYLERHNRHYLLACYLLHYVFVRPRELALLRIQDFDLHRQTLFIRWDVAKNWTDSVVTLPAHVIRLMIDLDVFSHPGGHYLFSDDFRPGAAYRSEKAFRDYWIRHLRRDLGFSDRYKFYSLKDTGITNMIRANTDLLSVRDQARHSSVLITDIYTPKDIKKANQLLLNYKGVL